MKNNHQFSKSQQVAIAFLTNFTEAISCWKNFVWFQRIEISDVREIGEDSSNSSKFKKLEKRIFFYGYNDILIAKVTLNGNQFTNTDNSKPTFWKVVEVHYVNNHDESRPSLPSSWTKAKIEEKDQILN